MGWEDTIQDVAPAAAAKPAVKAQQQPKTGTWMDTIQDVDAAPIAEKTIGQNLAQVAVDVGRGIDSVTGAPTRAGLDTLLSGAGWSASAAAAKSQFLEKPELAPTGKEIVMNRLGVSDETKKFTHTTMPNFPGDEKRLLAEGYQVDPKTGLYHKPMESFSKADVAGLGVEFVADPTLPLAAGAKLATKGLGTGLKLFNRGLFGIKMAENAEDVAKASKAIGVTPTPGMLIDSKLVKKGEDALASNHGRPGGIFLRGQMEKNRDAVDIAAKSLATDRSHMSKFDSGAKFSDDYQGELAKRLENAEQIYDATQDALRQTNIPIEKDKILKRLTAAKEQNKGSKPAQAIIDDAIENVQSLQSLDDIKRYRTIVKNSQKSAALDGNQRHALNEVYSGLTDLRSDSLKYMVKSTQTKDFAETTLKQLADADKDWREASKAVNETLMPRGKVSKSGPKRTAKEFFEKNTEIDSINKALRTNDPKRIAAMQKEFPQSFDTLKKAKIEEFISKSTYNGKINANKLAKTITAMPPETQMLLFGEKGAETANALKVIAESIPPNTNPSGTAKFVEFVKGMISSWGYVGDAYKSGRQSFLTAPELGTDVFTKFGSSKAVMPTATAATIGSKATINRRRGLKLPKEKQGLSLPVGE